MLYGPPGVGKTTMAADAPNAAFLCAEDGQRFHDVARIPWPGATAANPLGRASWEAVAGALQLLAGGVGDLAGVETLVVDTINALEGLCAVHVAGSAGELEAYGGGYNKGAKRVAELWRGFLADIDRMQARRAVNVLLIGHAKRLTTKNPGGAEWNRWGLALFPEVADLTTQWADEVLFATWEIAKADPRKKHAPGLATGRRVVHTSTGPGWEGKNRCGLADTIPLTFDAFWSKRSAALRGEIDPALRADAEALESMLDESKRVDAKGNRLLDAAAAHGPARLRKFMTWAQEQIETAKASTPEPEPPREDEPRGYPEVDSEISESAGHTEAETQPDPIPTLAAGVRPPTPTTQIRRPTKKEPPTS